MHQLSYTTCSQQHSMGHLYHEKLGDHLWTCTI